MKSSTLLFPREQFSSRALHSHCIPLPLEQQHSRGRNCGASSAPLLYCNPYPQNDSTLSFTPLPVLYFTCISITVSALLQLIIACALLRFSLALIGLLPRTMYYCIPYAFTARVSVHLLPFHLCFSLHPLHAVSLSRTNRFRFWSQPSRPTRTMNS